MGLDLRLLPIDHLHQGISGHSHTILSLGGVDWDLGAQIKDCARRFPDGHDITSYVGSIIPDGRAMGERYYGRLVDDAYGEPYQWLTAKELLPFLEAHWAAHPATAYVRALPSDGLIVLDWY